MNADVKAKWVTALRSGEFEQGTDYLNNEEKFCCLGVLSELAVRDGVIAPPTHVESSWKDEGHATGLAYDGQRHHLPESVAEWAGLSDGDLWDQNPYVGDETVADLNDGGASFPEIADLIEEHL